MTHLLETEAICLRTDPFSETSFVVTWLTPEYGRISTILKGAMRPKSVFFGQFDIFCKTELLFYSRKRTSMYIAKEIYALNQHNTFRGKWRASACASYICDLAYRVSIPDMRNPELFEILDKALDQLENANRLDSVLFGIELKLAAHLGLAPILNHCVKCRKPLTGRSAVFSPQRGAIACPSCGHPEYPDNTPVTPDILGIMNAWLKSSTWLTAANTRCTQTQSLTIENILGSFLEHHLDINPASRNIAMDCVRFNTTFPEKRKSLQQ